MNMEAQKGTITLIGSGEFGQGMAHVYRAILARAGAAPTAVFLDTPAGFELNADAISAKAANYFSQRLNLVLQPVSFKNKNQATALEIEAALRVLRRADLILAGPGSPTYAVRHWSGTPVWDAVLDRFAAGAHLVWASAAAIAQGICALPVYEIYKAGQEPHWQPGLDLFAALGMALAIVPHWNNREGGSFDTRRCYLGEARFDALERQLPRGTVVLGIDEYTACIFDPTVETCSVMGAATVTIRRDGSERVFSAGERFSFSELTAPSRSVSAAGATIAAPAENNGSAAPIRRDETARYLRHLARALDETQEPDAKRTLLEQAHDTMHEFAALEPTDSSAAFADVLPLIEMLVQIREALRVLKQFELADEIRIRLAARGIELQDTADGTTWRNIKEKSAS